MRHFYVPLERELFIELLEEVAVPPTFVDVLVDNNGAYATSPITLSVSQPSESFRTTQQFYPPGKRLSRIGLFFKPTNTATTWCTLYYAYDVETASSTFLVIGRHAKLYQSRLQQLYSNASGTKSQQDPFTAIAAMVAEMAALFEEERRIRDRRVQLEEGKTGFAPLRVSTSFNFENFVT